MCAADPQCPHTYTHIHRCPPLHAHTRPHVQMRAMFYADGDGIPLEEVDAVCRALSDIVDVMQLDTGLVIQNLKQVKGE